MSEIKNILHFTETSYPGGSETILAYIAKNLNPERYRSLVCVIASGWLTEHLDKIGVRYVIVDNKRPYDPKFLFELTRLIRTEKIDLVHAHEFVTDFYGSVAARLTGRKAVGMIHGKGYFTDKPSRRLAFKFAVGSCNRMIAVSHDLKEYLAHELTIGNKDRIQVIHNGIDLDKYVVGRADANLKAQLGIPADAFVAGTVGSLHEVKGLHYLLEAARQVACAHPNFRLLVTGKGPLEDDLKKAAAELGISDKVEFLGFRDDVPEILKLLDVYLCSSISEGLSLSILEAMAVGKAVVATNVGGNPELIVHGQNGYLVPSCDSPALAEKIISLIGDNNLRESFGKAGREIADRNFSLRAMVAKYEDLYEELLSGA